MGVISPALAMGACALTAESGWGPLAVVDDRRGPDALAEGTLQVDPTCVYLDVRGRRLLLVWPDDRTRWEPATGDISFVRNNGETVTVSPGQFIAVGGGEEHVQAGWLATPNPGCPDAHWLVSDVIDDPS